MAARKKSAGHTRKLDAETLVALGAERLAELVLAQADIDPVFARSVRMELAAKDDAGSLAHEIDRRLKTIRRSRGFVEWDKVRPLARELDQLRQTIAGSLAQTSPSIAVEQMRLLLSLAEPLFERVDDSSGIIGQVFRQAGKDLGRLWGRAHVGDIETLAAEVLMLIEADGYGVFDELLDVVSPTLGKEGRAALRKLLLARQTAASADRRRYDYKVGWLLPKLADLDDDVDAYIATVDPTRRNPMLNAEVAERLLNHGRAAEALEWIEAPTDRRHNDRELAALKLRVLEALIRSDEAQVQRRSIFERWLDPDALRAWLRALPAFEDFVAEQDALDHVRDRGDPVQALAFLVNWPDLKRAAHLVGERHADMEGRAYDVLRPAAEILAAETPAAATLLYRRLVMAVLDRATSKYYPYAVGDLAAASSLSDRISDDPSLLSHHEWMEELRRTHGRKTGFWSLVLDRRLH
jgi:hypothetical protein